MYLIRAMTHITNPLVLGLSTSLYRVEYISVQTSVLVCPHSPNNKTAVNTFAAFISLEVRSVVGCYH